MVGKIAQANSVSAFEQPVFAPCSMRLYARRDGSPTFNRKCPIVVELAPKWLPVLLAPGSVKF